MDGKERVEVLRKAKRGAAVVQAVAHENCERRREGIGSSKSCWKKRISQKISLDALHCKPLTLAIMSAGGGKYLVGLKENQKVEETNHLGNGKSGNFIRNGTARKKSTNRVYEFYDVLEIDKDDRWKACQIKTAIKVRRERVELKSGKSSRLTNEVGNYEELAQAVRHHWHGNEQSHSRCEFKRRRNAFKKKSLQKTMAGIRTLATTILEKTGCQNKKAQLEDFADDFDNLIITLKLMNLIFSFLLLLKINFFFINESRFYQFLVDVHKPRTFRGVINKLLTKCFQILDACHLNFFNFY